jgi:hypothetical protein
MKSIDIDAKHMIRNYIDSIEEYLRKHTRFHPNEIDSLLNEINDFVYLRSEELATDEERVSYSDVLKAIEECGSPSEICEQYLEQEKASNSEQIIHETGITKKISDAKSKKVIPPKKKRKWLGERFNISEKAIAFYKSSTGFGLYRLGFICFMALLLLHLIFNNFTDHLSYYDSIYPRYIYPLLAQNVSQSFCSSVTIVAFILVAWEGWVIKRWKTRLNVELGMDHSFDNLLIVWISRFSFLLVFLKTSLLFVPFYIWYTPIWIVLACVLERQLESPLWKDQIAPFLITLGRRIESTEKAQNESHFDSVWRRIRPHLISKETFFTLTLLILFGITFLFPWAFMGYTRRTEYGFTGYALDSVIPMNIGVFTIITVLLPILMIGYQKVNDNPFISSPTYQIYYGDSGLIVWLIRLLSIKSILLLTTFEFLSQQHFLVVTILVILLILSEIFFNTYGGNSIRSGVATLLMRLGSSDSLFKTSDDVKIESKRKTMRPPPPRYSSEINAEPHGMSISPPTEPSTIQYEAKPSLLTKFFQNIGKLIFICLSFIFVGLRILFQTIAMLLISFYEVILALLILFTSFSPDGSYYLPIFQFKDPWGLSGYYEFSVGGYTVWAWYALLLLGIQVIYIALVQFSGLMLKEPEGVVVKVGRNLSRFFLISMLISSIIQLGYFSDSYALLRIVIIVSLAIFSELTTWKVRDERKRWESHIISDQHSVQA